MCMWGHMFHDAHVEVKGQFSGVSSLLSLGGSWESNSKLLGFSNLVPSPTEMSLFSKVFLFMRWGSHMLFQAGLELTS